MFGNKRREFNARVSLLFPGFGFTLDDAGVYQTLAALDLAWERKYNDYESALYCAYLTYGGMLKLDDNRQATTLEKIKFIERDWLSKNVVQQNLVDHWRESAKEWEIRYAKKDKEKTEVPESQTQKESSSIADFELTGNMPDFADAELLGVYYIPHNRKIYFFRDCPMVAQKLVNTQLPITYLLVMTVMDENELPIFFVLLEKNITGSLVLGILHRNGNHENLGDGAEFKRIDDFETAAFDIITDRLGFELNDVIVA